MKEVWKTVAISAHKEYVGKEKGLYAIVYILNDGECITTSPLTKEQRSEIEQYYKDNYK
jgi:hypothetical protein